MIQKTAIFPTFMTCKKFVKSNNEGIAILTPKISFSCRQGASVWRCWPLLCFSIQVNLSQGWCLFYILAMRITSVSPSPLLFYLSKETLNSEHILFEYATSQTCAIFWQNNRIYKNIIEYEIGCICFDNEHWPRVTTQPSTQPV